MCCIMLPQTVNASQLFLYLTPETCMPQNGRPFQDAGVLLFLRAGKPMIDAELIEKSWNVPVPPMVLGVLDTGLLSQALGLCNSTLRSVHAGPEGAQLFRQAICLITIEARPPGKRIVPQSIYRS